MAIPITVPRLGWNMEEGVFAGWLKPDGAPVRAGESLFSLESDKATEEVECLDDGVLRIPPDGPRAGDKVAVGAVIGYLLRAGETAPPLRTDEGGRMKDEKDSLIFPPSSGERTGRPARAGPAASPRARRVAAELGVDWATLKGSGRTGRVRERDVRAAAAEVRAATGVAVSSVRRTIAERMLTSHRSTAPVTVTTTADATNLVNLRDQFKAAAQAGTDLVPGYTDFLVKLAAVALQQHPLLNASWEGEQIRMPPGVHIGVAVDTAAGLLVPVLRDVPSLGLRELAARARDLAERARQGKLAPDEMRGGTFTVTNLGAFGIDAFTPIINFPQCAALGVGRIQRRAVVVGGEVVARDQIGLSLTFDHRIVDGAPAARFVQTLTSLVENPVPWLIGPG
jgi:pyruvate dehydrogenase E2 component (dihydrolipoamide acetyltransferase)